MLTPISLSDQKYVDFINNSYQQLCSLEIIGFIQLSKFDRRVVNPSRRRLQTILLEILIKFRMHTQLFFWCYTAQMHFLHTSLSEVANACTQNSFTLLANTVFSTPDFITCIALVLLQKWCVLCVFSSTLQNRKGYLGWQLLTLFNIMQPRIDKEQIIRSCVGHHMTGIFSEVKKGGAFVKIFTSLRFACLGYL